MLVCAAADTKRFDIGGAAHGADRVRPLFSFVFDDTATPF